MPIPTFADANTKSSTDVAKLLCDRIRYERKQKGFSQAHFAQLCGIPIRTYKRVELYQCDSIDVLIRISQGFERAGGFETLFPPQPLAPRGIAASLQRIKQKMDARVAVGEAVLDQSGRWNEAGG